MEVWLWSPLLKMLPVAERIGEAVVGAGLEHGIESAGNAVEDLIRGAVGFPAREPTSGHVSLGRSGPKRAGAWRAGAPSRRRQPAARTGTGGTKRSHPQEVLAPFESPRKWTRTGDSTVPSVTPSKKKRPWLQYSEGLAAPLGYQERVSKRRRQRDRARGRGTAAPLAASTIRYGSSGSLARGSYYNTSRMPRYRYKRRRSSYRYKPYRHKRYGRRSGGFMRLEKKFIDQTFNGLVKNTLATATGNPDGTHSLGVVPQDNTESGRDGRHLQLLDLHVHGTLELDATNAADPLVSAQECRIVVVVDRQTNKATMGLDDLLASGATLPTQSFRDLEHAGRFRVLHDKILKIGLERVVGTTANHDMAQNVRPFRINRRLMIPVHYATGGTTGVTSEVTDNSIHIFFLANTADVLTAKYTSRVRFTK